MKLLIVLACVVAYAAAECGTLQRLKVRPVSIKKKSETSGKTLVLYCMKKLRTNLVSSHICVQQIYKSKTHSKIATL